MIKKHESILPKYRKSYETTLDLILKVFLINLLQIYNSQFFLLIYV